MRSAAIVLVCFLACAWAGAAFADPPAHAPAHGWRKKHDPNYVGYTGTTWERDYDVRSGRCNREQIGAVLGGVAGGVVGSRVGSDENRTVAVIIGAAVGALIGAKIGRELDDGDRGCFGHALELGKSGQRVGWENAATGVRYELMPRDVRKTEAGVCRDFMLVATKAAQKSVRTGSACQSRKGVWQLTAS